MPTALQSVLIWVGQGFGTGRIPFAPGSWGSLVGVLWFALLLSTRHLGWFFAGLALGAAVSVWVCGAAEKILQQTDPSSVVLDEIVAVPACFAAWVVALWLPEHRCPGLDAFFSGDRWWGTAAVVLLFRIFDIAKPWPIRQSQRLAGGWGVTIDDFLAATYVNLICALALWWRPGLAS